MSKNNEIINGKSIGKYCLNWTLDELKKHLPDNYFQKELPNALLIEIPFLKFWISTETNRLEQIGVSEGFGAKFLGKIGIGDTFAKVKNIAGDFFDEPYTYQLTNYPGICFELKEEAIDEDFDELVNPIEFIYVYI